MYAGFRGKVHSKKRLTAGQGGEEVSCFCDLRLSVNNLTQRRKVAKIEKWFAELAWRRRMLLLLKGNLEGGVMRNSLRLFAAACLLMLSFVATPAQSSRLTSLAQLLDEQAIDLAERIYGDYRTRSFSNRSDVEALYLAEQFSASARIFRRMVTDRRRETELKDGAAILAGLLSRADSDFSRRNRWNDVRRTVDDIQRTLDGRGEWRRIS